MAQHRHSVTIPVKSLDNPALQQCLTDPSLRVMVFCAAGNTGTQDIAFPHQSELKVNTGDVKANLRGLKNKPGSTRPVDITNLLRLKPAGYPNSVEFTYALTNKAGGRPLVKSKVRAVPIRHADLSGMCRVTSARMSFANLIFSAYRDTTSASISACPRHWIGSWSRLGKGKGFPRPLSSWKVSYPCPIPNLDSTNTES